MHYCYRSTLHFRLIWQPSQCTCAISALSCNAQRSTVAMQRDCIFAHSLSQNTPKYINFIKIHAKKARTVCKFWLKILDIDIRFDDLDLSFAKCGRMSIHMYTQQVYLHVSLTLESSKSGLFHFKISSKITRWRFLINYDNDDMIIICTKKVVKVK